MVVKGMIYQNGCISKTIITFEITIIKVCI